MEGTEMNERRMDGQGMMTQSEGLGEDFHYESIILRRADPDDCDAIINLVEIGEDDIYNRVYSYPKILKLIETAYLALTVIDRNSGAVVAFAAFEDYPQGQRGMQDDKHFNYWEEWLKNACRTEDFSAFNTLWLSYFICGAQVGYQNQHNVFKQVLHTVYTSLSDMIGVLFLIRGDADEDDIQHCFGPLSRYFKEVEIKDKAAISNVRGINAESTIMFSSRVNVIPYIEIRAANQEDHDDLADVFNSQSETVTEAYGEYFIAELIASQNEDNKAIVAQIKDKAVGLMGLTNKVDLKLLHKCFELDSFDNLLKPEFMEAIRARRALLVAKEKRKNENAAIGEKRKLKQETMRCNIIAQRIALQEHLLARSSEILETIDLFLQDEEGSKEKLSQEYVMNDLFGNWLDGFKLHQPNDYFLSLADDDIDLVYNIQTEIEVLMSTLENYGLPNDYINGKGHHNDWAKNKGENDKKKAKGKAKKKPNAAQLKIAAKKGLKIEEEAKRPTHFDLLPFQKCLKKFLACTAEARSTLRILFIEKNIQVRGVFKDKYGELSFKKVVDVFEFSGQLVESGFQLDQVMIDSLGGMLLTFGDIEVDRSWGDRNPPETEEQKRSRLLLQIKIDDRKKDQEEFKKKMTAQGAKLLTKEEEEQKARDDMEDDKKIAELSEKCKPRPQIKAKLTETSIHDLLIAMDKMAQYDRFMSEQGKLTLKSWDTEDRVLLKAKRPFEQQFVDLPQIEATGKYSPDPEIQAICEQLDDQTSIPDPPESAKNAFAMTLFCMESAFDCRSKDFLKYAFEQFSDKDYLIVTQPHTVAETALLHKFTLVPKKSINTFSHVLYLIHRDQLYEQDVTMIRSQLTDLDYIKVLIDSSGQDSARTEQILRQISEAITKPDAPSLCYTAKIIDNIIGVFLISKDVNLEYYKSHFHIQDQLLLSEHDRKGHCRLIFSTVNPIFERSSRFLLKEVLRLSGKTSMYFEVHDLTIIPTIFHELVHIRSRRFPHFLDRKWDHERWEPKQKDEIDDDPMGKPPMDGVDRNPLDEKESTFALCFTTKRLLSEQKILKNSRIVVVGASDTGISFVEALLSITYLKFSNIILIAPGGLPHHHNTNKKANLKAYSTSYSTEELTRLLLESRVTVIDSRMTDIDRSDKNIILNDGRVVPYDTLVLAMGIQDNTLNCDKGVQFVSQGMTPVPQGKRQCKGVLSIDDPYLHKFLKKDGEIMSKLTDRRRQTNCVIYGRSLNTYTMIQGMIDRGVQPKCITLAIPKESIHVNEDFDTRIQDDLNWIYPNAFEDQMLEEKIQKNLETMGITIIKECKLIEIMTDKDKEKVVEANKDGITSIGEEKVTVRWDNSGSLERIVLKRLDIPDQEEEEDEFEQDEKADQQEQEEMGGGTMDDSKLQDGEENQEDEQKEKKKKRKRNEVELECGLLVTCGHRDVDYDVFSSIHCNGLVYNGRLIVDKCFQSTDQSIFSAGSLCEFSNKYQGLAQGRSLRMDRYNGREMGSRLARSVFDIYDPQSEMNMTINQAVEELPQFYLPIGYSGVLPANLVYYHIKTSNPLIYKSKEPDNQNRNPLVCDNLDIAAGKGHFIKFTFNSIGLIDSVTYMGDEEVILQSLWSFVGLHENYLNQLTSRFEGGIIPNVAEFLSENWAIALYHEWFGDFCLRMRQGIMGLPDVQQILQEAFMMSKNNGLGLSRPQLASLRSKLDLKTEKMIEDETLEFIKTNMNHLPMYYIPGQEFA